MVFAAMDASLLPLIYVSDFHRHLSLCVLTPASSL